MSTASSLTISPAHERAAEIIANLPLATAENFQPQYPNVYRFQEALAEIISTEHGATSPERIEDFKHHLANASLLIVAGECHKPIDVDKSIHQAVAPAAVTLDIIDECELDGALFAYRGINQSAKPRTELFEDTVQGKVLSFMGHAVNKEDPTLRTPDPSRLVASYLQGRDCMQLIRASFPDFVGSAHEALLLGFEEASVVAEEGHRYDTSSDILWAGYRTNTSGGPHIKFLASVENTVGVKLGLKNTEEDIEAYGNLLNPGRKDGKLVFMTRFGLEPEARNKMRKIVAAIARFCPEALVLPDPHALTRTVEVDGRPMKVRVVDEFLDEISETTHALHNVGLKLGGVHAETTHHDHRLESVDHLGEFPTHPGNLDPGFNPVQLLRILKHVKNVQPIQ